LSWANRVAGNLIPKRVLILLEKIKKFFSRTYGGIKTVAVKALSAFDIRDCLVYGGLFCIGYGLYQLFPWLGWAVFGLVSMLLGLGWIIRVPK
jgi:hypothetical protein